MARASRFGGCTSVLLLAGLLTGAGPRALAGDEGDAAAARDLLAARILEAAEVRMRAKLEEARLLEAAGRREEALAALREVATIHEQALARVDAARSPLAGRVLLPTPVPVLPAARGTTRRTRFAPPPAPGEPRRLVAVDPVPAAVACLLRAQRPDGHFGPPDGAADPETTAFAVLALLDAVEDDAADVLAAVRRGASALAALDPRSLDPAIPAWGLAAAYGRLGDPAWQGPLRRLLGQVDLVARDEAGRSVPLTALAPAERALRALWILVLLEETRPLTDTAPEDDDARRRDLFALVPGLDLPDDAAGAYARDLLRLAADLPDDAPGARGSDGETVDAFRPLGSWMRGPGTVHDPLALLLGTAYVRARFGTDDPREGTVWWNRVLSRVAERQVASGADAGCWEPGDARSRRKGRVWTTAVTLLAWRAWDVPWREPVAR